MKPPAFFALFVALLAAGAFLAPAMPFIIDGGVYHDMARAMAERGSLATASDSGVPGAPPLVRFLSVVHEGAVYPQYPSGYAYIAAPFYALFGIHGLMLMNALSFAGAIWLIHGVARRFYDMQTARWAAGIFALATMAPAYVLGVWPHMIALAIWLGAVSLAIAAHAADRRGCGLALFAAAGGLIGAGVNIRIDIFLAGLALFFWLRLFARAQDRAAPLFLLLGAAPGVLLAALLNDAKFGTFFPFTYGHENGRDSFSAYAPIAALTGGAFAAAWALNIPALLKGALAGRRRNWTLAASVFVIGALLISPAGEIVWRALKGVYVLVFNLQAHDAYFQAGVERNEYGQLLFWGYPKKALVQSLPWLALAAIPVVEAIRTRNLSAAGMCGLCIAAPVCFYALNQWHGGGSYSMRYFLPAAPFLAILAAAGLRRLTGDTGVSRQAILAALAGAGVLYLSLVEIGKASERLLSPGSLYPQWVIAAALAAAIGVWVFRGGGRARILSRNLAVFALAYAAVINVYEEIVHERTRAEQLEMAKDIAAPLPRDALVVTPMPILLIRAEAAGVSVAAPTQTTAEAAADAAEAFAVAGRCVYFHNSYARDLVAAHLATPIDPAPVWAASARFGQDPRLAFFTFAGAANCRF